MARGLIVATADLGLLTRIACRSNLQPFAGRSVLLWVNDLVCAHRRGGEWVVKYNIGQGRLLYPGEDEGEDADA